MGLVSYREFNACGWLNCLWVLWRRVSARCLGPSGVSSWVALVMWLVVDVTSTGTIRRCVRVVGAWCLPLRAWRSGASWVRGAGPAGSGGWGTLAGPLSPLAPGGRGGAGPTATSGEIPTRILTKYLVGARIHFDTRDWGGVEVLILPRKINTSTPPQSPKTR